MHSMTGFGRGEAIADSAAWRAEAGSVNRKQLEVVIHLPRELSELEIPLRNRVTEKLSRGRVSISITSDRGAAAGAKLHADEGLARQYLDALKKLGGALNVSSKVDASDIVRWPGVFTLEQSECTTEHAQPLIEQAVDAAVANMLAMREAEGAHLKADITARLDALETMLTTARELAPRVIENHRSALRQRIEGAGLSLPLDDERLVKEIVLISDKCDISEELTRAASHIAQFRTYMNSGEPVGRPLDFLSQELGREFNTMGSKANDAALAQLVVRAKTELEKIREQVQNIE